VTLTVDTSSIIQTSYVLGCLDSECDSLFMGEMMCIFWMLSSLVSRGYDVSGFLFTGTIYAREVAKKDGANSSRKDERSCMVAVVMDFLCIILPIIFIFTVSLNTVLALGFRLFYL